MASKSLRYCWASLNAALVLITRLTPSRLTDERNCLKTKDFWPREWSALPLSWAAGYRVGGIR
jgi:hypothetical protein